MSDGLIKRLRDIGEEETGYGIRNEAADLIEQQAAEIVNLKHDIERHIANHAADLNSVAPAVDAQPVACLICNSTGNATPCAYPTEINRQQAARIERLRKEDLSLRALYEDACIQANKNAQDAQRYRWIRDVLRLDDVRWMNVANWNQANISAEVWDSEIDAALSQHTGEKDD